MAIVAVGRRAGCLALHNRINKLALALTRIYATPLNATPNKCFVHPTTYGVGGKDAGNLQLITVAFEANINKSLRQAAHSKYKFSIKYLSRFRYSRATKNRCKLNFICFLIFDTLTWAK